MPPCSRCCLAFIPSDPLNAACSPPSAAPSAPPVAIAIVKQLSNLRLEVLLENRDALSRNVREEVSPTSSQWGFSLGSTCIRKVAFRDKGMIAEIQRKVVNRLRQVTAAMRQAGDNEVAIIHSRTARRRGGSARRRR